MTQEQKVIRAKVGLLELAKQLGNVSQACKMMGYSRDSFYRFKELYDKGGELALQEISRAKPILKNRVDPAIEAAVVDTGDRATDLGSAAGIERAEEARPVDLGLRGARCVAASRPRKHQETAQGARSQDGAGRAGPYRGPARSAGEGQGRQGNSRRVRERMPGLLRRPGHLLCRHAEGRRTDLPADLHRHLYQGGVRQALRSQDPDHRGRVAKRPGDPVLRRARASRSVGC